MTYLLYATSNADPNQLGGKAKALAALAPAHLSIPAWFVLSPQSFYASLTPDQQRALTAAQGSEDALAALNSLTIDPAIATSLLAAVAQLEVDVSPSLAAAKPQAALTLAVRSSALDEDAAQHSFAGQLESFLNVTPADLPAKVVAVWRSAFSPRVYAYRRQQGLAPPLPAPAVLIQRMVNAEAAGVAFSADPVRGRRQIAVVAAVRGLGEQLVAGEANADSYHVARQGEIVEQQIQVAGQPVLTADQVRAVAALARHTEQWLGRPQDIEWAIAQGQLYLLQSRPITALAHLADPDGIYSLWDNSNIVESYGGITTPLTYSFARRAYEEVYLEFCRILGVPKPTIAANRQIFTCMIGLIRGRIYYNLLNWYRVLAMLPGFKANRHFMEQMMGVKEPLPDAIVATLDKSTWRQRLLDRGQLLGTMLGLVANHFLLARRKRHFYQRLHQALGAPQPDLAALRADELTAYYRTLDQQLLTKWDAPLINDFFAMIFYGLLRTLITQWCGDTAGTLQNDLLTGEGGMISAEPAQRVRLMAQMVAHDGEFVTLLRSGERPVIERALAQHRQFSESYQAYLDKFGDRCADELKLESPTLQDDPLPLLRSIGQLAGHLSIQSDPLPPKVSASVGTVRAQAEQRVQSILSRHPIRRLVFGWVLKHARICVRDRENLRFERTHVFGRARQIFVELGRRFYALDLLQAPRDIFYLEVAEILGFVEGTTTCTDLRGLVDVRKAEFARFAQMPAPVERFSTLGMVDQGNSFQPDQLPILPATDPLSSAELHGVGCCPGLVRGRARIVTNPATARLEAGDILVAERTDPSWIMIMPAAAGLLVARGSLLSHAAIVSRELGIPSIVSLTGVTEWLTDGEWVELDGRTGVVRRVGDQERMNSFDQ